MRSRFSPLELPFLDKLHASWPSPQWEDLTIVVAVSGGADSVALYQGLRQLRAPHCAGRIVVAHFNHGWRGAEADQDQQFVAELSRRMGDPFVAGAPSAPVSRKEADARSARYDFLEQVAHQAGARYVVTAHTANDQAETILHRVLRGTGLKGLAGIPRTRVLTEAATIIRPLLNISRDEVLAFLTHLDQPYREDSSNKELDFTRNWIRHALLPMVSQRIEGAVGSLIQLGEHSASLQDSIQELTAKVWEGVDLSAEDKAVLGRSELSALPLLLQQDVLSRIWRVRGWPQRNMSAQHWNQLMRWIADSTDEETGPVFPGGIRVRRLEEIVEISRAGCAEDEKSG